MKSETRTAYIALFVLTVVWGYNWVVIKIATQGADAFSVSAIRLVLGALSLFIAIVITRGSLKPTAVGPTIVLGFLQTTLFTILQTVAVISGGAGKTAILAYTMPFWLALLAWPFLHERLTRFGWVALALAAIGIACILTPFDFSSDLIGKMLAVLGAISWAVSAIYAKRLRARHNVELLSLTAWQMTFGMIPLALIALVIPQHHVELSSGFIASILYMGLPGTGLAWLLWLFILHRLRAGTAGIASLLTPVFSVFFAWLQLGERPGTFELAGIACIVAALILHSVTAGSNDRS